MKRSVVFIGIVGFGIGTSGLLVASESYPSTPKALVETYLRLDADAAGLSPATWPEIGQYTNFPQAPKWPAFVVIDRYDIGNVLEGHTRAQARVTYHTIGRLADQFTPNAKLENVVFYLTKVQDQWKVDSPPIMPHVSYEVMKKRLNTSSAANPKTKKANDALLQQIESARTALK